jgi:hypothetical protein
MLQRQEGNGILELIFAIFDSGDISLLESEENFKKSLFPQKLWAKYKICQHF